MASVGHGHYVVVVLHVGGSKPFDVKLVLQREPRSGKSGSLLAQSQLTKSMSILPFVSYMRKLALS
jgi:hypothetical protein